MEEIKYCNYFKFKYYRPNTWILRECTQLYENKASFKFWIDLKGQKLDSFCKKSRVDSIYASNAIEGITTTAKHLKLICDYKVKPETKNEALIAGYRDAYDYILENYENFELNPDNILQLHKMLYKYYDDPDAGKFKTQDNCIASFDTFGNRRIIFLPLSAEETPQAMKDLCLMTIHARNQGFVIAPILIATFVHDFLCIHPFADGNGRISRLLTMLLLMQNGFMINQYFSIDMTIWKLRQEYYRVLNASNKKWQDENYFPEEFIEFLLCCINSAYNHLEKSYEVIAGNPSALEITRRASNELSFNFPKSEIRELCPSLSLSAIESSLRKLVAAGELTKSGVGKSTKYHKK